MPQSDESAKAPLVIRATLHEPRRIGSRNEPLPQPQPSRPASHEPPQPVTSPLAQRLALAYAIERAIESGRVKNLAEVSRRLGITRARVTQLMALLFVAAPLQDNLLSDRRSQPERFIRNVASNASWRRQQSALASVVRRESRRRLPSDL